MSTNDITGDRITSKVNSKEFVDNFDAVFRSKPKPEWHKHDETYRSPVSHDTLIEVETYASMGNITETAGNIAWQYVKRYRVLSDSKQLSGTT